MRETSCDVLVVGGSTGGVAAAMAACSMGMRVILTEETDWIGGQLTSQGVPPDEHPWIEQFGCTKRYRQYRDGVRQYYREHTALLPEYRSNPLLNPGTGWVSRLCHEPRIGWQVLNQMLQPALASGRLDLRLRRRPVWMDEVPVSRRYEQVPADDQGYIDEERLSQSDRVEAIRFSHLGSGEDEIVLAKYVLDATELGDVLVLCGAEYVSGAESKADTQEPNAVDGPAQPNNVQGLTWCMALAYDDGSHRVIDKPEQYERWKAFKPDFWPGPHLGFEIIDPITKQCRCFPLMSEGWYSMFSYRQIVEPSLFEPGYTPHPVTIANWPQNDYFVSSIIDVDFPWDPFDYDDVPLVAGPNSWEALRDAKELSLSVLYWLQTEAPRHDGGAGYPGLYLRPDIMGTEDGFAKTPYIRESRRIVARHTVREQDVAAYTNPGLTQAPPMPSSVGLGAYRIDLHPSTSGATMIDTSSLPYQIPLGSLIPARMRNLLPACKNLGVTHITNGCFRLHPVEWNIGESSGLLASFCVIRDVEPAQVYESQELTEEYQSLLRSQGIELEWPKLRAL